MVPGAAPAAVAIARSPRVAEGQERAGVYSTGVSSSHAATSASAAPAALAVLRVRDWAHLVFLPLASVAPASLRGEGLWRGAAGCTVAACALGYAYGINAISDRATDLDRRKNPLSGLRECPRSALGAVSACFASALALAFALGTLCCLATTVSLFASTVYSVGPRLKALPGVGTLLNACIFAPLLALGTSAALPSGFLLLASCFVSLLLQNQLLHERADADEDAGAGTLTTARAFGHRIQSAIVVALGASGLVGASLWAPSRGSFVVACLVLGACSAWAMGIRDGQVIDRRRVHRWLSFVGGAALYAATASSGAP